MSSCIPASALDKQHFKDDCGIILTGTFFHAFDIHFTVIIDIDAFLFATQCQYIIVFIQPGITLFTD
jgi:hypothetical protein